MNDFKCGASRTCICGQLDYGGHEHCEEANRLLKFAVLWTLTDILDQNWRCWTIIGSTPDECYDKCILDFPGRTKRQWEARLVPVKIKLEDIPVEYRPIKHQWRKPWIKK